MKRPDMRLVAAAAAWSAGLAMMVDGTDVSNPNLMRWAIFVALAACIPSASLVMEAIAVKRAARYEQILRDVIRLSAEELVRARAKAEDPQWLARERAIRLHAVE